MYNGKPTLRGEGESYEFTQERLEEYFRCAEDILYFASEYFYIVSIDKGKHKIQLFEYQKKALKIFTSTEYDGKPNVIVLMPRQMGKTTMSTVFLLHFMLFNKDKTIAILANKETAAIEVLRRIKEAYQMLPLWMQQGVRKWNEKSLELENGMRLIAATTSSDSISGETVSLLYLDEFAKVKPHVAEEFITATLPVVSSGKTSKVIIVSTPLGMNHFHSYWVNANRTDQFANNFYPVKVNWWDHPERDDEWKTKVLMSMNNDMNKFNQEYGCRFLGSSSTLIDPDVLERTVPDMPIDNKWSGALKIYEHPQPNAFYVLGIDTGKGTGRDYSVCQVLKIEHEKSIKQVAVYRNDTISPHDYAQVCIGISRYYNNAQMMVENNGIGESLCSTMWYEYECEDIINLDSKGLGVNSNVKTKLQANLLLKRYVDEQYLKIVDKDTLEELSKYVEVRPNVFQGETKGTHDDCVTSLLWGLYFISTDYFDANNVDVKTLDEQYDLSNSGPIMFMPT